MKYWYFFFSSVFLCLGCGKSPRPLPKGHLRLDYPVAHYQTLNLPCRYTFQYSNQARAYPGKKDCWYNLTYPSMRANIFLTYFPVKNDLPLHLREVDKMVYGHTVKASGIEVKSFSYPAHRVYGNFYELQGETASNIQFYATDSVHHFVTGNLYFKAHPRPDSLAPAVDHIKKDILQLISTLEWK